MAQTTAEQRQRYPLPAYNFRVTVDGTSVSFAEVSGIAIEYQKATYRHGLSYWEGERVKTYYDEGEPVSITLRKGTVRGMDVLHRWIRERQERTLDVSLCDERGEPVVSWRVRNAVPVKLEAPTFDASAGDVAVESLEVLGSHVTMEYH